MIEVADIFRLHWDGYQQSHRVLPSERKAVEAILNCRTAACGGHVYQCDGCGQKVYSYHSCKHRACPKCHGQQTKRWLQKQRERLLPGGYYLLTFTLPASLRPLAWDHPKVIYGLLMKNAAQALQKLALDERYLGAQPAILGVLHTWTRGLLYHPHVHLLVSAGGLAADGKSWVKPKNPRFLVPGYALSKIFRGKMRAGLRKSNLREQAPDSVWKEKWVVHCRHAGSGEKALEYLARYVFRSAIANSRLEHFENGQVTFRYRDRRTGEMKHPTVRAEEFMRRFLWHILPKGCVKVRFYGLWSHHGSAQLKQAREMLSADSAAAPAKAQEPPKEHQINTRLAQSKCACCGKGSLRLVQQLTKERGPPA